MSAVSVVMQYLLVTGMAFFVVELAPVVLVVVPGNPSDEEMLTLPLARELAVVDVVVVRLADDTELEE